MADDFSANFPPLVSRNTSSEALTKALNRFVGRGKRWSVHEFSEATGIKERMLESAKQYPDSPDFRPLPDWAIISAAKFIGPAFLSAWLELADLTVFRRCKPNHDDLARSAIDYAATHAAARHPDSPEGVEISDKEARNLTEKAACIRN